MAKSSQGGTRGGLRGGLGDIYYQLTRNPAGDVTQLIKAWNKEKENPNTSPQAVSRMQITLLMYAMELLKPLIRGSFQYVSAGVTSVNYFSKINMKLIQKVTENYWDEPHGLFYPEKGFNGRVTMAPFCISEGSAKVPDSISVISSRPYNQRTFIISLGNGLSRFYELRKSLGFNKSDSMLLVIIPRDAGNNINMFRYAKLKLRFNYNDYTDITAANIRQFFDISGNVDAQVTFDQSQNRILVTLDNTFTTEYGTYQVSVAYHAVLISKYVKRKWQYSTSYLMPPPSLADPWDFGNSPVDVIQTWWPEWNGESYDEMIHPTKK